jgi:hypothetical protein
VVGSGEKGKRGKREKGGKEEKGEKMEKGEKGGKGEKGTGLRKLWETVMAKRSRVSGMVAVKGKG